jgi:hypothetical protein
VLESFVEIEKFIDDKDEKGLEKFIEKVRLKGF